MGVSESAGRSASLNESMGIPVVEFFGVGFIKKVIQRFIEFVRAPRAAEAKREQEIFEKGFLAGSEGRDELIFDFDFVAPVRQNFVANEVRASSGEIDGPGAAARAGYENSELGVDGSPDEIRLC